MNSLCIAAVGATVIMLAATPTTSAHSWYPTSCCSGSDCEAIPTSSVAQTQKGFHVIYNSPRFGRIDEYIPMSTVRGSKDGNFHGCWRMKPMFPRTICFFAPMNV
jgi:hypothetical protein